MKSYLNKLSVKFQGLYLLFFLLSVQIVTSTIWLCGSSISWVNLPISIILACLPFVFFKSQKVNIVHNLAAGVIIIAICTFFSLLLLDFSYDGNAYHQPIIYALANGWNPIYQSHNHIIADAWNMNLWIDHYCKGMETISAVFVAFTGNMESGKAVNFLFPLSTFFLLYDTFINEIKCKLTKKKILLYSIGLSFSLITFRQIFSYYIDQFGYYTYVLALLFLYKIIRHQNKLSYFCLFAIIVLSVSIKLNAAFWVAFLCLITLIILLIKRQYSVATRFCTVGVLSALFAICVTSANPYLTNTLDHSNPVYPLADETLGDGVADCAIPLYLQDKNRIVQVILSHLSRPYNDLSLDHYMFPYQFNIRNLYASGGPDCKTGGGGFFFVELMVLSILIFLLYKGKYKRHFIASVCFILISLVLLPMGMAFRYVPFIYLIPFIALFFTEISDPNSKYCNLVKYSMVVLLCANVAVTLVMSCAFETLYQYYSHKYVETIKKEKLFDDFETLNWGFCYKVYGDKIISVQPKDHVSDDYILNTHVSAGPNVYFSPYLMNK